MERLTTSAPAPALVRHRILIYSSFTLHLFFMYSSNSSSTHVSRRTAVMCDSHHSAQDEACPWSRTGTSVNNVAFRRLGPVSGEYRKGVKYLKSGGIGLFFRRVIGWCAMWKLPMADDLGP